VREDADGFLLQNTVFSMEDWENFLRKDKQLGHIWKKAAVREAQQHLLRFLIIAVVLLGLLGGIVSAQLGLWSLRAAVGHALETVTQQVARLSGTLIAPEAVGGRNQEQQEAPLSSQALPATTYGNKKANTGIAVTPSPQRRARQAEGNELLAPSGAVSGAPATPDPLLPNGQSSTTALAQRVGEEKAYTVKKVVVIRSGDTLPKILLREYGEYTKSIVALVIEVNPGLRNITRLEVGQRLILPERPE
jgi:nucleoid-associated protein YgaU